VATQEAAPAQRARIGAPAPRATTTKPREIASSAVFPRPPRDDDPGFSQTSRPTGRDVL